MNTVRKYRGLLVLGMILAVWIYAGTVYFFGHEVGDLVRIIAIPFILAGFVALATFFSE